MLERNTNIKIGDMYIVWFNERNANYTIIKIRNLEKEVNMMVNDYLKLRAQKL